MAGRVRTVIRAGQFLPQPAEFSVAIALPTAAC
jgi:hypothetical protein